jgi:hypothetical protein
MGFPLENSAESQCTPDKGIEKNQSKRENATGSKNGFQRNQPGWTNS